MEGPAPASRFVGYTRGSGDIATLSASKRMELLPFAQISSRLGGAIILIVAGAMVGLLG